MSRLYRLLVTGLVAALALVPTAIPAHAADTAAAQRAAAWLTQDAQMETALEYGSTAADFLLSFAAAQDPSTTDEVAELLEALLTTGPDYVAGAPDAAAKLAVALDAVGEDPRTFLPGIDLVQMVEDGIQADGSFGSWPGPFASGFAMVALARAGVDVPASMVAYLLQYQHADGGFAATLDEEDWLGQPVVPDADSTGMALMALLETSVDDAALAAALDWAADNQAADGSWAGFNPVNSTAILGAALATFGENTDDAVTFLVSQQQASGAFLNIDYNSGDFVEDILATTQAILLLGGVSYLDVAWDIPAATPSPSAPASPSAPVSPSVPVSPSAPVTSPSDPDTSAPAEPSAPATSAAPSASASVMATPSATASASSPAGPGTLPQTGADTPVGVLVAGLLAVAAGTGLLLVGRRGQGRRRS